LFDLPLNPGILEQRIGRLDRIGQTQTIRIHVPYVVGSSDEFVVQWYHRGLDDFETPLQATAEYQEQFRDRILAQAVVYADDPSPSHRAELDRLVDETAVFRKALSTRMRKGRDRLLELNSFDRDVAERVIQRVRESDADPFLRGFLHDLLDHFGVIIKEHEEGDVFYDPSHAYIEAFPSIPADGMLATYQRSRATAREDIVFLSADHPLVEDAIDLLINSHAGTSTFGVIVSDEPNLLLEAVFVLEAVADARWHIEQFLAPKPLRVLIDLRGDDLSADREAAAFARDVEDADIHRFLEKPGFNSTVLKEMLDRASEIAERQAASIQAEAQKRARDVLTADIQRLVDLSKVNDHVRPEEIELARQQLAIALQAIQNARVRLDAIRLVIEGEDVP
jgi:ATP-dependent helicase HepA